MNWILLITISILVAFPDGTSTLETKTLETRYFDSLESCDNSGKYIKEDIFEGNLRRAYSYGAVIKELEIDHRCEPAEQAT